MDPFTLAMVAGTGLNVFGKLMSGSSSSAIDKMQAQAYGARADAAKLNVDLLNSQADVAHEGIGYAASKERETLGKIAEAGRTTLAAQRSYFAGGNLDPTFGSPLLVQSLTAGRIKTDMGLAETSFAIDKANVLSNEANIRGQAAGQAATALSSIYSMKAMNEKADADLMAGYFGAGTALLSGIGMAGKFGGGDFSITAFKGLPGGSLTA